MGRRMGSKNKPKQLQEAGNSDFNLNEVEPSNTIASAAVTAEDLAFDRELQRMAEIEMPPVIDDPDPPGSIVKPERVQAELLRFAVEDYKPASTDQELREQIHTAKINDCDSIEATLQLAKRFCKDPTLETVGYFLMHDIKVYIEGAYEKAQKRDRLSIEERNFGLPKVGA